MRGQGRRRPMSCPRRCVSWRAPAASGRTARAAARGARPGTGSWDGRAPGADRRRGVAQLREARRRHRSGARPGVRGSECVLTVTDDGRGFDPAAGKRVGTVWRPCASERCSVAVCCRSTARRQRDARAGPHALPG
jgi:hypothetical protein